MPVPSQHHPAHTGIPPFAPGAVERSLDARIALYRKTVDDLVVDIADPARLSGAEHRALLERVARTNMAIYRCQQPARVKRPAVLALANQLKLGRADTNLCAADDGLTELEVKRTALHQRYIPYTNQRLNWHTDGYYHPPRRTIRSMVLHCVRNAACGGTLEAIDHEIVYGLLYRLDPAYVHALSAPDAMTIPLNDDAGGKVRGVCSGPVFFWEGRNLFMRYTERKRNILWKGDGCTGEAVQALASVLETNRDLVVRRRLTPGEGMVCNNVPHRREAFTDALDAQHGRLLYRGRFHHAIAPTVAAAKPVRQ